MEENKQVTPYDEMTQTREIQMLKTILPYLGRSQQMSLAMLIQYLQFKNTYQLFSDDNNSICACELPEGTDRRNAMLGALRSFCSPKEQETIDTILNIFCIMDVTMNSYAK